MRDTTQISSDCGDNFGQTGFCQLSNDFIDFVMPELTRAELVTYLYINRRTTGFHKSYDAISYSQFLKGICTRDGRRLDFGTGLSRKSLVTALDSLVNMGAIFRHQRHAANGACLASVYELNRDDRPAYRPGSGGDEFNQEPEAEVDEFNRELEDEPETARGSEAVLAPDPVSELAPTGDTGVLAAEKRPMKAAINAEPGLKPKTGVEICPSSRFKNYPVFEGICEPAPEVKSRPTKDRLYQNKVKQNTLHNNRVCDELRLGLIEAGIWPAQAKRLALLVGANGRQKTYLDGWTAWLKDQPNLRNPAAFLAKVIEANADLPAARPVMGQTGTQVEPGQGYLEEYHRRSEKLAASLRKYGLKV